MAEQEIRYLGDVQRLVLKEGDRLVVSVDELLSNQGAERLKAYLESRLPGTPVIVLSGGMKIGVLAASE